MSNDRTDYEILEGSGVENRRLLRQEELILEVTEALTEMMRRHRITQSQLAKKLGKSPGFVSQILAGGRNLTLRTVADVADALECRVHVQLVRDPVARAEPTGCEIIPWQSRRSTYEVVTDMADAVGLVDCAQGAA